MGLAAIFIRALTSALSQVESCYGGHLHTSPNQCPDPDPDPDQALQAAPLALVKPWIQCSIPSSQPLAPGLGRT